ncbi:hypothetical protein HY382_00970 [Candidatus Curtissbacteria bacterium]|nr:hypothetical protein [Candidatus Curtissbacteria bacterium]
MAVVKETEECRYVKELRVFQSEEVRAFFDASGVEVDGLGILEHAGWASEVKGKLGNRGTTLTLAEKKHLHNYGWCRLYVFEVVEHNDLPTQSVIEMQSYLVRPANFLVSTNLVKPITSFGGRFSPVETFSAVSQEAKRETDSELSGSVPRFMEHFMVVTNQFGAELRQRFTPQKTIR